HPRWPRPCSRASRPWWSSASWVGSAASTQRERRKNTRARPHRRAPSPTPLRPPRACPSSRGAIAGFGAGVPKIAHFAAPPRLRFSDRSLLAETARYIEGHVVLEGDPTAYISNRGRFTRSGIAASRLRHLVRGGAGEKLQPATSLQRPPGAASDRPTRLGPEGPDTLRRRERR